MAANNQSATDNQRPARKPRKTWGKLAQVDYDGAIAEIAAGASLTEIAGRYGATAKALRKRLVASDEPAYKAALDQQIASRLARYAYLADDAVGDLEQAVAKAREDGDVAAAAPVVHVARAVCDAAESAARHWRFLGERRDPDRWGEKRTVNQHHSGTVELVARPQMSRDEWVAQHAHLPAKVSE